MAQTAELLLAEIATMPAAERAKLLASLNRQEAAKHAASNGETGKRFVAPDPTPAMRWYNEHKAEYANQYIALEGDRLIAHSPNAKEVIDAVHAAGLKSVFFTLVPPVDEPEFAGF